MSLHLPVLKASKQFYLISYKKCLFMKVQDVFPECLFYIKQTPKLTPLICLKEDNVCHVGHNCMETLVKRIKYVFDQQPCKLLFLYFAYPDKPGSQRAVAFFNNLEDLRYLTFNKSAWEKIKKEGTVLQWQLPDELMLGR